ncbi:hypothetical protein C1X35_15695 [Pseudomonas sp. FW306-1C-G01A]|nr:hypothetical protein C1X56_17315 [Pseudomonas sp. GW101-1A09]PMV93388.1 hypothetical protein C1X51_15750 [Pseudomonas sp. FW306-2-2C-B10A]PMV96887.1 hypothetical protein C1X55_18210 [Pseudomonas sp. GW460-C8]PMW07375.1 hypothetical protein C1X50_04510 [Pseudomonas sp. MPR-TSA4]PMW13728.1 hypothetical protein C1X52_16680 [Pseudomonas sp. FW306-2-1A-C05A]PMW20234.1 hypothetical protein C1X40_11950 [Pseudomonas sp. GW456-11-11-14-TSB2]PMW20766.1 hypothetical protein C1X53_17350 [Pseudomonas s
MFAFDTRQISFFPECQLFLMVFYFFILLLRHRPTIRNFQQPAITGIKVVRRPFGRKLAYKAF